MDASFLSVLVITHQTGNGFYRTVSDDAFVF